MGVSKNRGKTPKNGVVKIMENPIEMIKWDDLGVNPTILGNTLIYDMFLVGETMYVKLSNPMQSMYGICLPS